MAIVNITKTLTQPTEVISTTAYTVVLADSNKVKRCTNTSTLTITVPPDTVTGNIPIGTQIGFIKENNIVVQFVNGSGVTLNSVDNKRKIKGQYGSAALIKTGANTWVLAGNLEA
jgi:hypothetical protein